MTYESQTVANGNSAARQHSSYHFNDDVMLYGGYSRGFKSGKFDLEFLHTNARVPCSVR